MSELKCKDCRYWHEERNDLGSCHIGPPNPLVIPVPPQRIVGIDNEVPGGLRIERYFTPVRSDDWCGKWEQPIKEISRAN